MKVLGNKNQSVIPKSLGTTVLEHLTQQKTIVQNHSMSSQNMYRAVQSLVREERQQEEHGWHVESLKHVILFTIFFRIRLPRL